MSIAFGASLGTTAWTSGATSGTLAIASSVPAGGKIVLGFTGYNSGAVPNAAASGGSLTWTRVQHSEINSNYVGALWIADAPSGLAATTVLTVTHTASSVFGGQISAMYFTGVADDASTPTDTSGNAAGTGGGGRAVTVSLTTTNLNDVIVYFVGADFSDTAAFTENTGYNEVCDFAQAGDGFRHTSGYKIVSATGSQSPGATVSGSGGPAFGVAIALKAAAGGSAVSATRALAYDIINSVAGTRQLAYDIKASVAATRQLQYDLAAAVAATRALTYDMAGVAAATRQLAYDIQTNVAATRQLAYDLLNAIAATRQLKYDLAAPVSATRQLAYDILASVSATRDLAYDILTAGAVSSSRQLQYDVQALAAATRQLQYDLVNGVASQRQLQYDMANAVAAQRRLDYNLGNVVATGGLLLRGVD